MARFTGKTVSGGLSGLLAVTFPVQAKAKAEVKAKADAVAKALASAKAERERQATLRRLRASRARSAVLACPVCLRAVEGRSAACVLYKLVNGTELSVAGFACDSHAAGDSFGDVGTVQAVDRNVSLTLEPEGRFYIPQPKAEVTPVASKAKVTKVSTKPGIVRVSNAQGKALAEYRTNHVANGKVHGFPIDLALQAAACNLAVIKAILLLRKTTARDWHVSSLPTKADGSAHKGKLRSLVSVLAKVS